MDNVYCGHWSTDYNWAKYITMSNKKVNLRVATMATHQSTKLLSLQLATYGWLFEISYEVLLVLPSLILPSARRIPDNLSTPMMFHIF